MAVLVVTGIDTGVGKTVATGRLARFLGDQGLRVITSKPVQTGCQDQAEDLLSHRQWMGCGWLEEDRLGLTCSYCFPYPASPHLAARLASARIDLGVIDHATAKLETRYDWVVMEGAGGVCVPLNEHENFLDFIARRNYPVVVVTSSRLGSINHTCLTLNQLHARGVPVWALLYNHHNPAPQPILEDTRQMLAQLFPKVLILDLPDASDPVRQPNFSPLLTRLSG